MDSNYNVQLLLAILFLIIANIAGSRGQDICYCYVPF